MYVCICMCVYVCVYMHTYIYPYIPLPTISPHHRIARECDTNQKIGFDLDPWGDTVTTGTSTGRYVYICVCMVVYGVRGCVYFQRTITITIASTKL